MHSFLRHFEQNAGGTGGYDESMTPENGAVRNAGQVMPCAVLKQFWMFQVTAIKRCDVAFGTADECDDGAIDGWLASDFTFAQRNGDRLFIGGDGLRVEDVEFLEIGGDEFAVEGGEGVVVVVDAQIVRWRGDDFGNVSV